jgi:hypothetical protein
MWTWVLNDGASMIGQILFTWKVGTRLDSDVKIWRYCTNILLNPSHACFPGFAQISLTTLGYFLIYLQCGLEKNFFLLAHVWVLSSEP